MFGREVTLQMQNGNYNKLLNELADISGKDIALSHTNPDTVFNLDYKRAALWNVLEHLSERGTVQVGGRDFEKLKRLRRVLLSDEKTSLCVKNTPVSTFVTDLASLTGLPLRVAAGSQMAMVNVQLSGVTLKDILVKVSEQTGTKITDEDPDSDTK